MFLADVDAHGILILILIPDGQLTTMFNVFPCFLVNGTIIHFYVMYNWKTDSFDTLCDTTEFHRDPDRDLPVVYHIVTSSEGFLYHYCIIIVICSTSISFLGSVECKTA